VVGIPPATPVLLKEDVMGKVTVVASRDITIDVGPEVKDRAIFLKAGVETVVEFKDKACENIAIGSGVISIVKPKATVTPKVSAAPAVEVKPYAVMMAGVKEPVARFLYEANATKFIAERADKAKLSVKKL
jgi:hypothetical protein